MKLSLSLAQINIHFGHPEANLALARDWLANKMPKSGEEPGERLILFPELWTTGYDLKNGHDLARENAALLPQLRLLAQEYRTHIGGSMLLERSGQIYNTFVYFSPTSREPVTYEKVHLFRLMEEDLYLSPGEHLQHFTAPWGETGLSICYDLRFPEMFRRYAVSGVQLILISAEWPIARVAHWQTLLRARAIENQCFVAAVNCVGVTGGETFGGRSAVISPWGETLVKGSSDQPDLLCTDINLDEVNQVRSKIPVFQDRRPDLYQ